MTSKTTASVIALVESIDGSDRPGFEQAAITRAKSVFSEVSDLKWFYHDAVPDRNGDEPAVVPFASEAGRRRIQASISKTTERRKSQLNAILDFVESSSSNEAVQSYEVFRSSRKLGTWYHPTTTELFDGTRWTFGSPILNEDRVKEIRNHHAPSNLAVVDLLLRY